ncbi:MAG TPA: aldo/keto reductase [Clostridiaceae bacterium]
MRNQTIYYRIIINKYVCEGVIIMEYVNFGRTGRKVSRIGYGGATAGLKNYLHEFDPQNIDDRRGIIESIEKALELGINYFDIAPGYGNGQSEEIFGEALEGVNPKDIFLATKGPMIKDGWGSVRKSLEDSLKRLKRDYVDLLQIHGSTYSDEQICYNFLFQHPYETNRPFGSIQEAETQNMGIATMRAPTSGWFQKWIKQVNPSNNFDYTPALIQFVLSNPLVDVALIGMRSAERVKQNVDICNDMSGRIDIEKLCKYMYKGEKNEYIS